MSAMNNTFLVSDPSEAAQSPSKTNTTTHPDEKPTKEELRLEQRLRTTQRRLRHIFHKMLAWHKISLRDRYKLYCNTDSNHPKFTDYQRIAEAVRNGTTRNIVQPGLGEISSRASCWISDQWDLSKRDLHHTTVQINALYIRPVCDQLFERLQNVPEVRAQIYDHILTPASRDNDASPIQVIRAPSCAEVRFNRDVLPPLPVFVHMGWERMSIGGCSDMVRWGMSPRELLGDQVAKEFIAQWYTVNMFQVDFGALEWFLFGDQLGLGITPADHVRNIHVKIVYSEHEHEHDLELAARRMASLWNRKTMRVRLDLDIYLWPETIAGGGRPAERFLHEFYEVLTLETKADRSVIEKAWHLQSKVFKLTTRKMPAPAWSNVIYHDMRRG